MTERRLSVLVTGFQPFLGEEQNPSQEVVRRLAADPGPLPPGVALHTLELPVVWDRALDPLARAVDRLRPRAVIMLGQSRRNAAIGLERVAVNISRGKDEDGVERADEPIAPDGPAAYLATLPVGTMLRALLEAGIPAEPSHSAGTYLCNYVFYGLVHLAAARGLDPAAGFVHLPLLPAQAARARRPLPPSMALADMIRAVRLLIGIAGGGRSTTTPPGWV